MQAAVPDLAAADGELPIVVVAGARAGVGATTVALNLSAVLADRGERVLLVDSAQQQSGMADSTVARRNVEFGLADVLSGKCGVEEAVMAGPAGMQMLLACGRASRLYDTGGRSGRSGRRIDGRRGSAMCDLSRQAQHRLLSELQSLENRFDLLVVDAGRGPTPRLQQFWSRARLVVLVTTPDDAAVLDAYATLKRATQVEAALPVRLLVNRVESDGTADAVRRRIENSCQRFLSRRVPALPALPRHIARDFASNDSAPRVWEIPNTSFGHAALWLGRAVSDLLAESDQNVGRVVSDELSRIVCQAEV